MPGPTVTPLPTWLRAVVAADSEASAQFVLERVASLHGRPSGLLPNEHLALGARCPACGLSVLIVTDGEREGEAILAALRDASGCLHAA